MLNKAKRPARVFFVIRLSGTGLPETDPLSLSQMIDPKAFTQDLETWYKTYARDLPWRGQGDPYAIWIAEIMSHQTQIQRVADHFYPRFIQAFPTAESLAESNWEAVFPVWEGLGYYQRGRNMIRTAQTVVKNHNGVFPQDPALLETLPGIGAYTAAAIASFAYGAKVPAVDTNVQKIIHILWPTQEVIDLAQVLVSHADSGADWNSAMMDLASQLRAGKEVEAPLDKYFSAETRKKFIPIKKKRKKNTSTKPKTQKLIAVGIACIHQDGKYLIQSRPEGKSFVGFWEFPGGKREPGESFRECVKREIKEEIDVTVSVRPHFFEIEHKFGPKTLLLRFHRCQIQAGTPKPMEEQELQWVAPKDFHNVKFLKTNHKVLEKLKNMRV